MTRFVLPPLDKSWIAMPLGKLALIRYGSALVAESRQDGDVPVYGSGGLVGKHNNALRNHKSIVIGRKGSVGAIYLTEGPFWCIDTAYFLDDISDLINLDYLAAYLQTINLSRLSISVAIPGLNRQELASVPVPLPTIPEQKLIVDSLRQSQKLLAHKKEAIELANRLPAVLFEEMFGIAGATSKWPMEPFGKHTTYSKYGPRFPDQEYSDHGIHILRTTDMNSDGTIRWSEAPKLALTEKQIAEHSLKPGTLIISRSGTIGPVALFDGPTEQCVAGAYLIEFGIADTLENEFARTLFLTPYIQSMLKKAVRSVAQPNINAPNIKAIKIPVPPIELQRAFSKRVKELRSFNELLAGSVGGVESFLEQIVAQAFSGKLTEKWRSLNSEAIDEAANARNEILGLHKTVERSNESQIAFINKPTEKSRPARHWLINELSEFQHAVWTMLRHEWRKLVIVDDPEAFNDFCTNPQTTWPIEHFNASPNRIRRTLEQLAGLGLIAKVSVPRQNATTQQTDYLTAFRPLRDDENSRLRDAAALKNALNGDGPLAGHLAE